MSVSGPTAPPEHRARSGPCEVREAQVLREYNAHLGWDKYRDSIYRGGTLLATVASPASGGAVSHQHTDHLGTPRLITDAAGNPATKQYHAYYPYGQELTATYTTAYADRQRFTGHERDLVNPAGQGDDLDYMHARHYSPVVGRFVSTDVAPGKPGEPQTWNRYSYVSGNPLLYVDPDGKERAGILLDADIRELTQGTITREYLDRLTARGVGAAIGGAIGFGILPATVESSLSASLSGAFRLYGRARGNLIHEILGGAFGGALPRTFPVIDRFLNGVATSTKSLDLGAKSYQNIGRLSSVLRGYVNKLASFKGARLGDTFVAGKDITSRVLELVIQKSSLTEAQARAIAALAQHAQQHGVVIRVIAVN